jgi:formylglycine-generating enzyme required for sulfatase activity
VAPFAAKQAKQHQQAWADYLGVPMEVTNGLGMKLRLVPPGEFLMGSTKEQIEFYVRQAGEKKSEMSDRLADRLKRVFPQHPVRLTRVFYLGVHEVTRRQFRRFVEATGFKTDAEKDGKGGKGLKGDKWLEDPRFVWNGNLRFSQTDDHPVVHVSWNDAVAFCKWLTQQEGVAYRLPTEAQWEYACRAGNHGEWCVGDDESLLAEYAWYDANSGRRTHPVGQKRANAFGLCDMHGNVWEWCNDWYADYRKGALSDPHGPQSGSVRVSRGGCWYYFAGYSRSVIRFRDPPSNRFSNLGFRVAADLPSR